MKKPSDVLKKELALITTVGLRKWTKATLDKAPDYFYVAQASSSGKYHPKCTIKKGGLVTHVKRAVYLVNHICEGWGIFKLDRDIVISAVILHDIAKENYANHSIDAQEYFASYKPTNSGIIMLINKCIENHMGRWTPDSRKIPIADYSLMELAVYTADYLSSRKDLTTPKDKE